MVARAKALRRKVLYKHVFRNALIPIVHGTRAFVAAFFSGSLLIETVLARRHRTTTLLPDHRAPAAIPVVMEPLYFFTLLGLVVKLVGDLHVAVDPLQFACRR